MDWLDSLLGLFGGGSGGAGGAFGSIPQSLGGLMGEGGDVGTGGGMGDITSMLDPMHLFGGGDKKPTPAPTIIQPPPKISTPQYNQMGMSQLASQLMLQSPIGQRLMLGQQR